MAYDRFLIAPFDSGLDKSATAWLTPEDSFQRMNNAYLYRGRVRKRFGSRWMGGDALKTRFRILLKNTNGAGDASGNVPGTKWKVGQQFSIGSEIFTVYNPAGGVQVMYSTTGVATTHTFNITTGAYNFVAAAVATPVYFYPSEPVMGLDNWESGPVNDHPAFGFDTQFAYKFSGNAWDLSTGSPTWKGSDSDFFWVTNWRGATSSASLMFVTNFNATTGAPGANDDPMYYWDGTNWVNFSALTIFNDALAYVQTARIILPFKGYLLLLNIKEQDAAHVANTEHSNRCRFSWIGSPIDAAQAWREPNNTGYGGAGFVDAATQEAIIGAEFIKDHLIVYFERSTWELVYTGNAADPFIFQKLNSELGTQSTFSTVIFDKVVLSISNTGVCACNGSNVERIDDSIPNDIFDIRTTNNGVKRVAGIRDYQTEVVYWSWPINTQGTYSDTFPAKILVYNYKNGTWAYNDDTITAWGYFEQDLSDIWAGDMGTWEDDETTWASGVVQAQNKRIIAGNQQGFTFIVDADLPSNAPVMQVTNITTAATPVVTIVNHNLAIGDYISFSTMNGITMLGTQICKVVGVTDENTITIAATVAGTYTGGGLATRVSRVDIVSKQWNPYIKDGYNFQLAKMDFCVQATSAGEITVDYSPNSAVQTGEGLSMITAGTVTNSLLGTSILETCPFTLYPIESFQQRLWHPIYFQTQGDCIQIRMYFSDAEMVEPTISQANFTLEGIVLYTKATSSRLE